MWLSRLAVSAIVSAALWLNCFAEAVETPRKEKLPPAVEVSFPKRQYTQTADSIRGIDFKNRSLHLSGEKVRLRNGFYQYSGLVAGTDAFFRYAVQLEKVIYFGNQEGGPQMALVSLDFFEAAGSSTDQGIILVFSLIDKRLALLQELTYDRQAPGAGEIFHPRLKILTIKARASDGSAHCCPQYLETARFRWNRTRFELVNRKISPVVVPD